MPPFRIDSTTVDGEPGVRWLMDLNEAREVAEYLDLADRQRATEMAFDLRTGVQLAISDRKGR